MKIKAFVLLLIIFTMLGSCVVVAEPTNSATVLLVYNAPGSFGEGSEAIRGVVRSLSMSGVAVSLRGMDAYTQGTADRYNAVVIFCPENRNVSNLLIEDLAVYPNQIVWIGYGVGELVKRKALTTFSVSTDSLKADTVYFDFGMGEKRFLLNMPRDVLRLVSNNAIVTGGVSDGSVTHPFAATEGNITAVSLSSNEEVLYYCLTNMFWRMFGFAKTGNTGFYVKIDYIYPVSDYDQLAKMGEYLKEKSIPFAFVVMPVYENIDLPEMDDYIRMLIHLRECGGTPVIHCPVINQIEPKPEDFSFKLTRALEVYTQRGIYPVGIEAPEMLLYKPGFEPIFDQFKTYFFEKGTGVDVWKLASQSSLPTFDGRAVRIPPFSMAVGETSKIEGTEVDAAQKELGDAFMEAVKSGQPYTVNIPSYVKFEAFKKTIDLVYGMSVMVSNIKSVNHNMTFAAHKLEYTSDWIILDGKPVENLLYQPHAIPKQPEAPPVTSGRLSRVNAFITAIAGAAILFFFFALMWARRLNLRKFFRR